MSTIRPNGFPQPLPTARPAAAPNADAAKLAAARAFFQMAAGQPQAATTTPAARAPAAAASAAVPVREAPRPQRLPDPAAEAPQRVLRPGSLLDIRV